MVTDKKSPGPILNYQVQEAYLNKKDVDVAVVEKVLKENTNLLTRLVENTPLIGDSRKRPVEFKSQNAQELHAFLIEQEIPKALADTIVIYGGIENLEALQVALNDGTFREIPGVGAKKEAKVKAVVDMHLPSEANVSSTPEIDSDPSTVVNVQRAPSVRRVKSSSFTPDVVKSQNTLSRAPSHPLLKGESGEVKMKPPLLKGESGEIKFLKDGPSSP